MTSLQDRVARARDQATVRFRRWFFGQRPIGAFVGRQTALTVRPRPARLAAGIVIPGQSPRRAVALLVVLVLVLAVLVGLETANAWVTLAILPLAPLLGWFVSGARQARFVLFAEHAEVQQGGEILRLPYGLFRGARLVTPGFEPLVIVDGRALDGVALSRGGQIVARGREAKLAWVSFVSPRELRLPESFATPTPDLVNLLSLLADAETTTTDGGDEGSPAEQAERLGVRLLAPDVIEAPAAVLAFPPRCIVCDAHADEHTEIAAYHPLWAVLASLGEAGTLNARFLAPTCRHCREAASVRETRACRRRALAGALVGLTCSAPLYLLRLDRFVAIFLLPLTVAGIGAFIGWLTGYPAGRLVRASTNWRGNLVRLPLPNATYVDETVSYSSRPRG